MNKKISIKILSAFTVLILAIVMLAAPVLADVTTGNIINYCGNATDVTRGGFIQLGIDIADSDSSMYVDWNVSGNISENTYIVPENETNTIVDVNIGTDETAEYITVICTYGSYTNKNKSSNTLTLHVITEEEHTISYIGWTKINDKWYYYSDNSSFLTGWQKLEWNGTANWYYFNSDGVMLTGWQQIDWNGVTNWYYFYPSGAMATGWIKPGNVWYYLNSSGVMLTGWQQIDWNGVTNWYYFYPSGAMATGWIKPGNVWYYLNPSGVMVTGWQKLEWNGVTNWYYFNNSGAMLTGWQTINNKLYYFASNGVAQNV